ncbi:hypothetical protein LOTGIDRAFT_172234 [Lottia gigantea]|uniref:Farnesoic acid O-methyl transferase domain-containing protein n=1 Tax=Lottia gigantea TaxID=225164 RepID=V4B8S3_LOTGI|nr:hypothetical protein LOTGIDRAFT_172234 [Lottia gigantea]ESP02237.1 hypothetical protein LOTGIDRAFT_172234 [Lottia gigantea]
MDPHILPESTNTSVITTQKEHVYVPLLDHEVDVRGVDFITFYVKTCSDVHVGIASEESNFQSKMYVVMIGGSFNSVFSITKYEKHNSTRLAQRYASYLNCNAYLKFNISWTGGIMKVFASDSLIMQGEIGMNKFPINYLGISTWKYQMGNWIFEIPESLAATSKLLSYYSVTSPYSYLPLATTPVTSTEETVQTFSDSISSSYQITSFESISKFDTVMPSEGTRASFDYASPPYFMTSSENLQTSLFSSVTMMPMEGLHKSISTLEMVMSSENLQAPFDSTSSGHQMASSKNLLTSFNAISSFSTMTSWEGGIQTSRISKQMTYLPEGGNSCVCFCDNLTKSDNVNERITEIQKELFVSRQNLSATTRRYISVSDNRPSAVSLGVTGIVCLVCPLFLVVIMPDFLSFIIYMNNRFGIPSP